MNASASGYLYGTLRAISHERPLPAAAPAAFQAKMAQLSEGFICLPGEFPHLNCASNVWHLAQ